MTIGVPFEHFGRTHAVTALDLRGVGRSDGPAAGHFHRIEVPEQVNAMIARFLAVSL